MEGVRLASGCWERGRAVFAVSWDRTDSEADSCAASLQEVQQYNRKGVDDVKYAGLVIKCGMYLDQARATVG